MSNEWPSDVRGPKIPPQIMLSASIFEHVFHKEACNWDRPAYLFPTSSITFPYTFKMIPWRRKWQPTPVFLPGKIPWTEEPGRLQSMGLQSWTQLSNKTTTTSSLSHKYFKSLAFKEGDLTSVLPSPHLAGSWINSLLQTSASHHLAHCMLGEQTWFSNRTSRK